MQNYSKITFIDWKIFLYLHTNKTTQCPVGGIGRRARLKL